MISTTFPNNIVILHDEKIVAVDKILQTQDNLQIEGQVWRKKNPVFDYPCDSSILQL